MHLPLLCIHGTIRHPQPRQHPRVHPHPLLRMPLPVAAVLQLWIACFCLFVLRRWCPFAHACVSVQIDAQKGRTTLYFTPQIAQCGFKLVTSMAHVTAKHTRASNLTAGCSNFSKQLQVLHTVYTEED